MASLFRLDESARRLPLRRADSYSPKNGPLGAATAARSPRELRSPATSERGRGKEKTPSLLFPIDAFASLVTLLSLDRQGGDRPRFQPLEGNRLSGFLAIAVSAVFDTLQSGIDLGDQLALPITGPQLDRPVGLGRSSISKVGMILI